MIVGVVFTVRHFRGRQGERTLRDTYAKGDVDEAEYRERLWTATEAMLSGG